MFRKFISLAFAAILCLTAHAQGGNDALSLFRNHLLSSRAEFSYDFTVHGKTKVIGSGKAVLQNDCFLVKGNGLEIYCDGKEVWTVDRGNEEVMVESLNIGSSADIYANPALFIRFLTDAFDVKTSSSSGSSVQYTLVPKGKSDMAELSVSISPNGSSLRKASVKMKDGTATDFAIPSFKFVSAGPAAEFHVSESDFGRSYVITDLR